MPLSDRVGEAFRVEEVKSFGPQYLGVLLDSWREIAKSLRTCLSLIVALMVAFLVLRNARDAQVTIGPLKLRDIADLLIIIPVVVAVMGYEVIGLVAAYGMYRETVFHVIRVIHPSVYENNMELMLAPPTISLMGGVGRNWEDLRKEKPGVEARVLNFTTIAIFSLIFTGSFGFLFFAYLDLYADPHADGIAVTVSLAAALLYAVRTLALLSHTSEQ